MKLVLYVPRKPKSANAKMNRGYREALHSAAKERTVRLLSGPLYTRIIWFHRYFADQGDVDNILKPIHDALKGAAYVDDRAIVRTTSARINIAEEYAVDSDPLDPEAYFELLRHLDATENRDILYIEVGEQSDAKVCLGPVL